MRVFSILLLALCISAAAHAGGQHDADTVVQHIFDMVDKDQDGHLSPAEFGEAGLESFGVPFEECDLDGDGLTSKAEYTEVYRRHHPPTDEDTV